MNPCLVALLILSIFGSQFHAPEAQVPNPSRLTAVIRIQSLGDNSFLAIRPSNYVTTTTTTTEESTESTPVTEGPDSVTSVPGGNNFGSAIVYWKVGWARSLNETLGSEIVASDPTTAEYRCLITAGEDKTIGIVPVPSTDFPTNNNTFVWNLLPVFDANAWAYRYQIKSNDLCLSNDANPNAKRFVMKYCPDRDNSTTLQGIPAEFLYNILS